MKDDEIKKMVRESYAAVAEKQSSCCAPSTSCCGSTKEAKTISDTIGYNKENLAGIPDEADMGLGCGNPVALVSLQEGDTVLDLGSGGGIDVFLAAQRVGPTGRVIGVDMTDAMVAKATATADEHGYDNAEFRLGEIEQLPVDDASVDVVISNCVINLSPDKARVFSEAHRVLRPNGRILISDIVTEGALPDAIRNSFAAWAGCVAGALEKQRYLDTIRNAGFQDVRIVSQTSYDFDGGPELNGRITSVQVEARKH